MSVGIFSNPPPGTAKSMVAGRLKIVFKGGGKSFDYQMSRISTPDEIFGPISISRLKNDNRYERLTTGYLPEADVVFLDEIWKAGPSIQNTLLTVINEHIFHNGGQIMRTPMKIPDLFVFQDKGGVDLLAQYLNGILDMIYHDSTDFETKKIQKWLRELMRGTILRVAKVILPARVKYWENIKGLHGTSVTVKRLRMNVLGQCSNSNHITLQPFLLFSNRSELTK